MNSKHPDLLAEQLRIMDELCELKPLETHHRLQVEKISQRKRELRERNNAIC